MKPDNKLGLTLLELIISIVLLAMVMMGFYGIDMFSRQQFIATDKKAKVQNEANFIISHVSKTLLRAIGDVVDPAVTITNAGGNTSIICATIDSSSDGVRNFPGDSQINYCYNDGSCGPAAQIYTMVFNGNISASPKVGEVIGSHVQSFQAVLSGNFLTMNISTCWDPRPAAPFPCGTLDNPSVNLTNIIKMPSVSLQ